MFYFNGHCPHCNSDKGFTCFGRSEYVIRNFDDPEIRHEILVMKAERSSQIMTQFSLAGICRSCQQPIVAACVGSQAQYAEIGACMELPELTSTVSVEVQAIFPQPTPPYSHTSLPEAVRLAFVDLQNMVSERKMPFFIIGGCRVVLENAVRNLGGEGKTLYQRVQNLRDKGIITSSLADWASIIREAGNAAVHEMGGTPEEARELVNFTKVFLQFTFELPATIASLRSTKTDS